MVVLSFPLSSLIMLSLYLRTPISSFLSILAYGKFLCRLAWPCPSSPIHITSPVKLTEQSIPRYFMCIHFPMPWHLALPLFGRFLLVLQDQDQVSSLRAMLEFPQTGTSTQDSLMLQFTLAFMIAVNHRLLRGLIYVSVFPTGKSGICL